MAPSRTTKVSSGKDSSAPSGAVRARLDAEVKALTATDVGKVPSLAQDRIEHLAGFVTAAARDVRELCAVGLAEGKVEPWEIDVLAAALAEAAPLGVAVRADQVSSGFTLSPADAAILAETRAAQSTVLWAFRRLRFAGQPARLKELDAIEVGDPEDVADAVADSARIVAIANHDDERAWFSALECGEPAALAVVQKHHAHLSALAKRAQGATAAAARRDRLSRVWTIIGRIEQHVRRAADYRYHNQPKRAEYRAFETPTVKKLKAARQAERPVKLAAKKAAKKAADEAKKAAKKAAKKKG